MIDEKRAQELLESLEEATKVRVRRFKNYDRVYWSTKEMNVWGNLICKVGDIEYPPLREFLSNFVSLRKD